MTGNLRGPPQREVFKLEKLPNSARVKKFAAGKYSILVFGDDKKWYAMGRSRLGHFNPDNSSYE